MHVVGYSVILECRYRPVVRFFPQVVGAYGGKSEELSIGEGGLVSGFSPVPHESIFETRFLYGSFFASDWKTPSAIVDRQMLPRHTKSTETWSGILVVGREG